MLASQCYNLLNYKNKTAQQKPTTCRYQTGKPTVQTTEFSPMHSIRQQEDSVIVAVPNSHPEDCAAVELPYVLQLPENCNFA